MRRSVRTLWRNADGAVAPTVALSLTALIAVGGIAFDYARMASLDSELQNAADQAALAAATQLDGLTNSRVRATAAANQIVSNFSQFVNTGSDRSLAVFTVAYCSAYDDSVANNPADPPSAPTGCTVATSDADAKVAVVTMAGRRAQFAFTPIVGASSSGDLSAQAAATMESAICKVPPVMLCNPSEPVGNQDELLDFNPPRGVGLKLVTGSASVPGNFGWLESGLGNGSSALAGELGYNVPKGPCQAITGVTTKTGMDTSVLNAFNTRFDVYANGNQTCPSQGGGTCSPALNTRKDLVCDTQNGTSCKNKANWTPVIYDPYWDSDSNGTKELAALPTNGSLDPAIMGYPHDLCHSSLQSRYTCGIVGSGTWDRDAYFRVNYGWTHDQWVANTGLPTNAARYDVYKWELAHPNGTGTKGIDFPQPVASQAAFSHPASGNGAGVGESASQPDRRTIAVAVLNCRALNAHGKTVDVPVPSWLKVFLVEPAIKRGSGSNLYSDTKDIYVEFIEKSKAQDDQFSEVVRRDVPYLIK
ncbi:pilus assembly protein TadG-related protein [Sphingomonas segetis]|jgi:Flp pilus assembly protein TadG|uniref:pilus assembly protein TadG-related protein n=1 Tax=Sphingomonas segetis TaxID=1104779 RepID=UPI0012D2C13A|nr:pilus assembly protein TadG-related protein [Sphingomonas segetis]